MKNNLILEFLEIYINQIIYIRRVYPRQIFRKRKAYCLPVFCSIYPPLNDYLRKSLNCVQHLIETKELSRVEIMIYNDDDDSQESFIIDIMEEFLQIDDSDKYLMILQENFRQCICEMEMKSKVLPDIKRSSKFKILLHTKERAYQKLCSDSNYQDFLWRKVNEVNKSSEIIPISSTMDFISLHIEHR